MADGLRNATLEALLTHGPWTGGQSHPCDTSWTLLPEGLRAYYEAIRKGSPAPWTALGEGAGGGSSRRTDRANALLKGAGLIRYDRLARMWVTS